MPSWATQFLEVTLQTPSDAVLLKKEWPNLDTWCGFYLCCQPPHQHNNKVFGMIYGGSFDPSSLSGNEQQITLYSFIEKGHLPQFQWPDKHDHPNLYGSLIFRRNGHAENRI